MKIRYYLIKLIKNKKLKIIKFVFLKRKECWMGWTGLGPGKGGCWDGFCWKKVNLLKGIFVALCYIVI